MNKNFKLALIGLDTSHALEFARRIQAPNYPRQTPLTGFQVTRCLRFVTPFQNADGLDKRQRQLEAWNIAVTDDWTTAVADCDGLLVTINDATLHYPYFQRSLELQKPIFLDKPLADSLAHGRAIVEEAAAADVPFFCSSALRYDPSVVAAAVQMPAPATATVFGPLGTAASGSSLLWYGVHTFEMLQRLMGRGAVTIKATAKTQGWVIQVVYSDHRLGIVELTKEDYRYGGQLRDRTGRQVEFAVKDCAVFYDALMTRIADFFRTGQSPLPAADMLETMALLDAVDRSVSTGEVEHV